MGWGVSYIRILFVPIRFIESWTLDSMNGIGVGRIVMKLILGSQSANRKAVLERAGYVFDVMAADIDEKAVRHDDWYHMPLLIARAKAEALLPRIQERALLITADVVTIWNGDLREKPRDTAETRAFLTSFSKSPHPVECVNGLVVTDTGTRKRAEGTDVSKIWFGKIPDELIATLIGEGKTCDYAGGFTLLDPRMYECVSKLEGSYESVLGMPLHLLRRLIEEVESEIRYKNL